jgi:anti-sigma factor RsiW
MTCAESTNLFSEYLDAQIAGTAKREFDEHVHECSACAQRLELMRFVRVRAGNLERKRLPDTFNFEMRRILLAEMTRQSGWLHRLRIALSPRPQTVWSAAVGTAFATVCFVALWLAFPPGGQPVWNSSSVAESESALEGQSVRYVLEHLPLDGEPIESTGKDTARVIPVLPPQAATAVQPVSATF